MIVEENERYSSEYHAPDKRSISNALQVFFKDGSSTNKIEIEYPIGHKFRREEGIPILLEKFKRNLKTQFHDDRVKKIFDVCNNEEDLLEIPVNNFIDLFVP